MSLFHRAFAMLFGSPAPPVTEPAAPVYDFADDLLYVHNRRREFAGVAPLQPDQRLAIAAQKHAEAMAAFGLLTHAFAGSGEVTRLLEQNYTASFVGENIARGHENVDEVVAGWIASRKHRENALSPNFAHVGFGRAFDADGVFYWCALFATESARLASQRALGVSVSSPAGVVARLIRKAHSEGEKN